MDSRSAAQGRDDSRALAVLGYEISEVSGGSEYAIFGSTALKLREIIEREPQDIDVMVTRRVWGELLPRDGWEVSTPNAGDPPILVFAGTPQPLHLFFDWRDDAVDIDPAYLIATADMVGGFWCAAVTEVLRHKRAAYGWLNRNPLVAKHLPDIEACERYLEEANSHA